MGKLFPEVSGQVVTLFAPPGLDLDQLCYGSSWSLSRKAGLLNFCTCTQARFVMADVPGHPDASSGRSGQARICQHHKSCIVTVFWLKYPPVPSTRDRDARCLRPDSSVRTGRVMLTEPYRRAVVCYFKKRTE
jgi:hypothetical protein